MSYATRNENGDNMGNTFVRCPVQDKQKFNSEFDRIFGTKGKPVAPGLPHDDSRLIPAIPIGAQAKNPVSVWEGAFEMPTSIGVLKRFAHATEDDYNGL